MNGKTELTAALTAIVNGVLGLLSAFGVINLDASVIANINGILVPMALLFLGNRVKKVENTGVATNHTVNRVEAAQPESVIGQASASNNPTSSSSSYSYSSSDGRPFESGTELKRITP